MGLLVQQQLLIGHLAKVQTETLNEIVRRAENNLLTGSSKLGEHVERSMHDTIERIFAYLNSRFTDSPTDSLGRDKPFFNIVTAATNIWFRATDIDRKDIVVQPDKNADVVPAFFASILLQEWMTKAKFGVFLNNWGRVLAQYGSAIVKFVDRGDELDCSVVPWNRAIVDPIDFYSLPRIEKIFKTPAQLIHMATEGHPDYVGYNLEAVKNLIDSRKPRENLRGQTKDNISEFLEIYEVHGEMSQAVYKRAKGEQPKAGDENIFFQQMHVISWIEDKKTKKFEDVNIYCGKEKKDPYMLTHLIPEDGQTLSVGAVETLFDAQWMANHTMKAWKDQMDLASKLVFQTADTSFLGKNVLTNIEVGDIFTHSPNMPIEQFPNVAHDIGTIQNFLSVWQTLGQEVSSTPDAARGINPPSNQPLGTTQIVTNQGLSLFEIMTENKGLALEDMLRTHIIPFLKSKMDNEDEVMAILADHDIKKFDSRYVPRQAIRNHNNNVKEGMKKWAAGETTFPPQPFDQQMEEMRVKQDLAQLGNVRPLSPGDVTWKDALKDLEWNILVQITSEQRDKQVILQNLVEMLKIVATISPQDAQMIYKRIMQETNLFSPIELSMPSSVESPVQAPAQVPQDNLQVTQ